MNKKLEKIYSMIELRWFTVADIGCDHAFLSVKNAINNDKRVFYNVDNKKGPLEIAKRNHELFYNIDAYFILANGIRYFSEKRIPIDCCVIAGVGGITCCDILKYDSLFIKNYIIQVDNNQELLEDLISKKKWIINDIVTISDRNKNYLIYKIYK